jgi:histone H3/H4
MARTKQSARLGPRTPTKAVLAKRKAGGKTKQGPVASEAKQPRKKPRFHPGTRALREIRKLQKSTHLLVQKCPFQRLCREITKEMKLFGGKEDQKRFELGALLLLQEAAEAYIIDYFNDVNLACLHGGRVTIMHKDMTLVKRLRRENLHMTQVAPIDGDHMLPECRSAGHIPLKKSATSAPLVPSSSTDKRKHHKRHHKGKKVTVNAAPASDGLDLSV